MNKQITLVPIGTDPKSSLPPQLSRSDDETRAVLTNGRQVSASARRSLQDHLDKLNLWLCGCSEEDVIPHVSVLRSVMTRAATSPKQEDDVLLIYCGVLCELPAWAVKRSCDDFLRGRVGDGEFAPKPAAIAARCRALMDRYIEDRARIERALGIGSTRQSDQWEDELR